MENNDDTAIEKWIESNRKPYAQQIQSLQQKIQSAVNILDKYCQYHLKKSMTLAYQLNYAINRFKKIYDNIILSSMVLETQKQQEFNVISIVLQNDGFSLINEIEHMCIYMVSILNDQSAREELELFQSQRFDVQIVAYEFRYCCEKKMFPDCRNQELICKICGRSYKYNELIFEKKQYQQNEGGGAKVNKYNPMRNFNKWMEKITCRDDQVPRAVMEKILQKFQRDYQGFQRGQFDIPIEQIRKCLKTLKLSQYNTYASYIKQYLTLKDPPVFDESDIRRMSEAYSKIIHIYYKISDKYNIPYCPHVIIKIIENLFPEDSDKHRIRYFMHFQNRGTTWKFDIIWKEICAKLEGFVYSPLRLDHD